MYEGKLLAKTMELKILADLQNLKKKNLALQNI